MGPIPSGFLFSPVRRLEELSGSKHSATRVNLAERKRLDISPVSRRWLFFISPTRTDSPAHDVNCLDYIISRTRITLSWSEHFPGRVIMAFHLAQIRTESRRMKIPVNRNKFLPGTLPHSSTANSRLPKKNRRLLAGTGNCQLAKKIMSLSAFSITDTRCFVCSGFLKLRRSMAVISTICIRCFETLFIHTDDLLSSLRIFKGKNYRASGSDLNSHFDLPATGLGVGDFIDLDVRVSLQSMFEQNGILHKEGAKYRVSFCRTMMDTALQPKAVCLFAMSLVALTAFQNTACANEKEDAAAAAQDRAIMMQRYVVSATRVGNNPWRYASIPGFEVLSRASDEKTNWWLDALRRGLWIENKVLPKDWLPESPVPNTVIIDDTDLETIPISQLRSQAIKFRPPDDVLTWGRFSEMANIWNDQYDAHDQDTYAINSDVYGVDTRTGACVIGLVRVFHCAPSLPGWLIHGLLGKNCGVFRESFMPVLRDQPGALVQSAEGPGTLWVSLDETQRLLKLFKKDKRTKIAIPPLGGLFAEAAPSGEYPALWESEAGLFVRWGLIGPGHDDTSMSRAFLELVRRARSEPVTERVFTECFGFGYAAMEVRLDSFLKVALAQPTSVSLEMPYSFPETEMKPATADQIGRILGDWLRMQGNNLRSKDTGNECGISPFFWPDARARLQGGQRPPARRRPLRPGRAHRRAEAECSPWFGPPYEAVCGDGDPHP